MSKQTMSKNPMLVIDAYKLGHIGMYPDGMSEAYANLTPRNFRIAKNLFPNKSDGTSFFDDKLIVFGTSAMLQIMIEEFDEYFFNRDLDEMIAEYIDVITPFLGGADSRKIIEAVSSLYDLGYLPLAFKAMPEGSKVGPGVPILTWYNTHPDFAWLPGYMETYISTNSWKSHTTATIAGVYRKIGEYFAELTGADPMSVNFQFHDFSSRGLSGSQDVMTTGAAHLTQFWGSDSISSVPYINRYYKGALSDIIGLSVPATEHSVMCAGGKDDELSTYRRLFKQYPTGIISIVSDTWDYWNLITKGLVELKDEILEREENDMGLAKVVIRPDSGDPADIVCGTESNSSVRYLAKDQGYENVSAFDAPEAFGTVEVMAEIFGTTKTEKGYKELNPRIGLIYGDSITPHRAYDILDRLMHKNFTSSNIVFGVGSYSYQYNTRDTFGFAVKTTNIRVNDLSQPIFKDPKTDRKKTSAKGYMAVLDMDGEFVMTDMVDRDTPSVLKEVLRDSKFDDEQLPSFEDVRLRSRLNTGVKI